MTASTEMLERRLLDDLTRLGDRLADTERFCRDLYGALAGYALEPRDGEGRLALSFKRAEELLNEARAALGLPRLEGLAQSGLEGRLGDRAREALESLGWEVRPRRTDEHDPAHVWSPEDPPPGTGGSPEWERRAHEEAELERHRQRLGETRRELHERHGA
jgi:hypothetical protein